MIWRELFNSNHPQLQAQQWNIHIYQLQWGLSHTAKSCLYHSLRKIWLLAVTNIILLKIGDSWRVKYWLRIDIRSKMSFIWTPFFNTDIFKFALKANWTLTILTKTVKYYPHLYWNKFLWQSSEFFIRNFLPAFTVQRCLLCYWDSWT